MAPHPDIKSSTLANGAATQPMQELQFVVPKMETTPSLSASARKRQSSHVIRSILSTSKKAKTTPQQADISTLTSSFASSEVFSRLRKSLQPLTDALCGVMPATPAKSDTGGGGRVEMALTPGYLNNKT